MRGTHEESHVPTARMVLTTITGNSVTCVPAAKCWSHAVVLPLRHQKARKSAQSYCCSLPRKQIQGACPSLHCRLALFADRAPAASFLTWWNRDNHVLRICRQRACIGVAYIARLLPPAVLRQNGLAELKCLGVSFGIASPKLGTPLRMLLNRASFCLQKLQFQQCNVHHIKVSCTVPKRPPVALRTQASCSRLQNIVQLSTHA